MPWCCAGAGQGPPRGVGASWGGAVEDRKGEAQSGVQWAQVSRRPDRGGRSSRQAWWGVSPGERWDPWPGPGEEAL